MLDKKEIIRHYAEFLQRHRLDAKDFVVVAGGAMVMLDLRQTTNDIHLNCPFHFFRLVSLSAFPRHVFQISAVATLESTLRASTPGAFSPKEVMCTEGVWHHTPQQILAFKRSLNRPKDQEDIRVLELYLQGKKT